MKKSISIFGCLSFIFLASCAGPKAIFTVSEKSLTAPAVVEFTNTSENAESFEWDFGDGSTSTEENPSHRYMSSGNYEISLKAMKENKAKITKQRLQIAAPEVCLVQLSTKFGNMLIELYDDTPLHRDNFSKLAEEGYYDDLLFHRVIDGFMIQGGDPNSKNANGGVRLGAGGPGYNVPSEITTDRLHYKGALAAARKGDRVNPEKASSGSQFYIVHGKPVTLDMLTQIEARNNLTYSTEQRDLYLELGGTPFLDNEYTVFGRVIEGLDVIDKIAKTRTDRDDRPEEDVTMKIMLIK